RILSSLPAIIQDRNLQITFLSIEGAAIARLGDTSAAEANLRQAENLCLQSMEVACGGVSRAFGVVAIQRREFSNAQRYFRSSLSFAKDHADKFQEAAALLNLGAVALMEEHFGEAADWSKAAYLLSDTIQAKDLAQNALGNLGWALYRLGDS